MNKLDKQFAEMMKNIQLESPSPDFSQRLMSRIQAEAVVRPRPLLQDYQPVISKRTWIIISVAFIGLLIYISWSGNDPASSGDPGLWTAFKSSLSKLNSGQTSILSRGMGLLSGIPAIAYLIILASLSLWTIDLFLSRFTHQSEKIK